MNTLVITHNHQKKKFQWKKNFNPEELRSLLGSVFKVREKIIGLRNFRGKTYDLSYFLGHPHEALTQPYTLVLEGERSPEDPRGTSFAESLEKPYTPTKKSSNILKQKYLAFLETMYLESSISEKEYLSLKCLYFEDTAYIHEYFNEEIRDYRSFCDRILRLLILRKERASPQPGSQKKSPLPQQRPAIDDLCEETFRPLANLNDNRNVSIWVEGILKSRLGSSELRVLERLIRTNDELLFSTFKVFENERDEEEMVDTVLRIVQKYRDYEGLVEQRVDEEGRVDEEKIDEGKVEDLLKESYFKSKRTAVQEDGFGGSGQKIAERPAEKRNSGKKVEDFIEKDRRVEGSAEKKPAEGKRNEKSEEIPQKMALSAIFNDFIEETAEQFEEYELGLASFLFKDHNDEIIKILKTCQSIELAVKLAKGLTNRYWDNLLTDNFSADQISTLNKEVKEIKSEDILKILRTFRETSKVKVLLTEMKEFLERRAAEVAASGVPQTRERGKTGGFSNMVGQRILEKKTSFNLTLRRNQSFQSDQRSNQGESLKETNGVEIKIINFGENAELKEIINRFHDKDDNAGQFEKYRETLKEILEKADFIKKSDAPRYFEQLESNSPLMLDICAKYEKTRNVAKLKKSLMTVLEKADESIDFQASPLMKNKVKKLNSFKYLIRELFSTKTITKKQEKLFFYLYMEEDMPILSAYEVYRITEDMQDFLETLQIIGKFHFFKTKLWAFPQDFDEIEQFDEMVEKQLSLLFAYKRYLTVNHRNSLEKIIRAGDISLLKVYQEFKKHKNKDTFINSLVKLAEDKTVELENLEKIIRENMKGTTVVDKRKETIENFKSTKFLKDCTYFFLLDKMIEDDHVLIQALFEIYHNTKDKGDFIENIKLVYKWRYKQNLKDLLKLAAEALKMSQAELLFLMDCAEEEMPNLMGPYEVLMLAEQSPEAEEDFKDTLNIILRVYKREIHIFERSFYTAAAEF